MRNKSVNDLLPASLRVPHPPSQPFFGRFSQNSRPNSLNVEYPCSARPVRARSIKRDTRRVDGGGAGRRHAFFASPQNVEVKYNDNYHHHALRSRSPVRVQWQSDCGRRTCVKGPGNSIVIGLEHRRRHRRALL